MKKALALGLMLLLLVSCFAVPAFAQGSTLETLYFSTKSSDVGISPDSYPEVCLTNTYWLEYGSDYYEPWQLRFPCPEGTYLWCFDDDSAQFEDPEGGRSFFYALGDGAYETFLNKCDNDEYIIADGSEGVAIYLEPSRSKAHAMIGFREMGKNTKLKITVSNSGLKKYKEDRQLSVLTEMITAEADRVLNACTVEKNDIWWSKGRFTDVRFHYGNNQNLGIDFVLPASEHMDGAADPDPVFYPIIFTGSTWKFVADYDKSKDKIERLEISVDTYSYPANKLKDSDESAFSVKLENGMDCLLYLASYDHNQLNFFYASVPLNATNRDRQVYLDFEIHLPDNCYYDDGLNDATAMISSLMDCITVDYNYQPKGYVDFEPYSGTTVAPAVTAEPVPVVTPEPAPAPADPDAWTCPACGTADNTGKFCYECGTKKPDNICLSCGYEFPVGTSYKFCPECGSPR